MNYKALQKCASYIEFYYQFSFRVHDIFLFAEPKTAKRIQEICSSNYQMYMRRRRPDSLEVQQMKEQKREEARQKAREREALKREIRAREEMEKSREGKQKKNIVISRKNTKCGKVL